MMKKKRQHVQPHAHAPRIKEEKKSTSFCYLQFITTKIVRFIDKKTYRIFGLMSVTFDE